MNNQWKPINELPEYLKETRRMFVVKAIDVAPMEAVPDYRYNSDPWCVWFDGNGGFVRWPHKYPPTHFCELPE